MKLEHVAINVPNAKALAQWLIDNLGMRMVVQNDVSPFMHFVADETGSMLEIYSNPVAEFPDYTHMHPITLHLAFTSANIEADRARLISAGAAPVGEINVTPEGHKLAFFHGPDGVPVQLVQRSKPLL